MLNQDLTAASDVQSKTKIKAEIVLQSNARPILRLYQSWCWYLILVLLMRSWYCCCQYIDSLILAVLVCIIARLRPIPRLQDQDSQTKIQDQDFKTNTKTARPTPRPQDQDCKTKLRFLIRENNGKSMATAMSLNNKRY